MRRKVINFVLEIDVHAATCPGVWLCPDGDVSVQLKLFDEVAETRRVAPVFPILYHEKLTFQKVFPDIYFLTELQEALDKEVLCVELVQWPMSGSEIVLATFTSTLLDVLYPSSCRKTTEIDLLMDPSVAFPGILSPKLESSTKTTIEEIPLTESELLDVSTSVLLNSTKHDLERFVVTSIRDPIKRQRKVCHSRGVHEKKGGNCTFIQSPPKHEKSRRHSPFSIRDLDTSVNTYESFLNSTRQSGRKKDFLNSSAAAVRWTSVSGSSSCADKSPVRRRSTFNKNRKNTEHEAGSSSSGDKSSTGQNTTINKPKESAKIEIDPKRAANNPVPHDTSSCLMCSQYSSFFEEEL